MNTEQSPSPDRNGHLDSSAVVPEEEYRPHASHDAANTYHSTTTEPSTPRRRPRLDDDDGDQNMESNHRNRKHGPCLKCCHQWPRVCTLFIGIVLPLWLLILITCAFGIPLCNLEMPQQIELNNQVLAARTEGTQYSLCGYVLLAFFFSCTVYSLLS